MLVDLARNDVNRVCDPLTTRVDKLMVVQKVRPAMRPPQRLRTGGPMDVVLTRAVLTRTAPGLRGVGRAAAGQDALRRVSLHFPRR